LEASKSEGIQEEEDEERGETDGMAAAGETSPEFVGCGGEAEVGGTELPSCCSLLELAILLAMMKGTDETRRRAAKKQIWKKKKPLVRSIATCSSKQSFLLHFERPVLDNCNVRLALGVRRSTFDTFASF
jgi:hypothetical protein